ncbi:hypothetical protein G6F57_015279 [Rhizopus arrhizus]|nr:hypothetical protein G6F57_015279 [Rhizopus arrhizus]
MHEACLATQWVPVCAQQIRNGVAGRAVIADIVTGHRHAGVPAITDHLGGDAQPVVPALLGTDRRHRIALHERCIDAAGATIDPTVLELVAHVDFRWQATQPRVPGQIGVLQRDIVARKVRIDLVTQWSHPTFGTEAAAGQVGAGDVACVECGTVGTAEIDHHPAAGVEGELAITAAELRSTLAPAHIAVTASPGCGELCHLRLQNGHVVLAGVSDGRSHLCIEARTAAGCHAGTLRGPLQCSQARAQLLQQGCLIAQLLCLLLHLRAQSGFGIASRGQHRGGSQQQAAAGSRAKRGTLQ